MYYLRDATIDPVGYFLENTISHNVDNRGIHVSMKMYEELKPFNLNLGTEIS